MFGKCFMFDVDVIDNCCGKLCVDEVFVICVVMFVDNSVGVIFVSVGVSI